MNNLHIKDEDRVDRKPDSMELTFKIKEEDIIGMNIGDITTRRNGDNKSGIGAHQYYMELGGIMQGRNTFYTQALGQLPDEKVRLAADLLDLNRKKILKEIQKRNNFRTRVREGFQNKTKFQREISEVIRGRDNFYSQVKDQLQLN